LASSPGLVVPLLPIGRLGAVDGDEINDYLQKVIEYENLQNIPGATIAGKGWMKNFIHVAGGKDSLENITFKNLFVIVNWII
jgi:hypothetical protein